MQKPLSMSRVIAAPVDRVRASLLEAATEIKGLVLTGGPDRYQARLDPMPSVHLEGVLALQAQGPDRCCVSVNGVLTAPRLLLVGRDINSLASSLFDELERRSNGAPPQHDVDLGL